MFNLNTLLDFGAEKVSVVSLTEKLEMGYWHPDMFFNNEYLTPLENNDYIISDCVRVVRDGGFAYYRSLVRLRFVNH